MKFKSQDLLSFANEIFQKIGVSEQEAEIAATNLIAADLRGVDSHGIARLSGYIRLYEHNRVNASPNVKVVHETPSTAVIDGDAGLGLVLASLACL